MKAPFSLIVLFVFTVNVFGASDPEERVSVHLEPGLDPGFIGLMEDHAEGILRIINHYHKHNEWQWPAALEGEGAAELERLLDGRGYYHTLKNVQTFITQDGAVYSIGGLVLRRSLDELVELHELVLFFDEDGSFTHAELISGANNAATFMVRPAPADEEVSREVLNVVEQFRQAYNEKNIAAVRELLKPDSRIVAGVQLPAGGTLYRTATKSEYLEELQHIFDQNPEIQLSFSELDVLEHPFESHLYGIHLRQHWEATNYSDEGRLFLVVDLQEGGGSAIQVRSWASSLTEEDFPLLEEEAVIVSHIEKVVQDRLREAELARVREAVREEETRFGYADVSANTDSLFVSIYTAEGDTLQSAHYMGDQFRLELAPASYLLGVARSGFEPFETEFTIQKGMSTDVIVDLQPVAVAGKPQSWVNRNRWYLIAGGTLIVGGAITLFSSGSEGAPAGIPFPPGRP